MNSTDFVLFVSWMIGTYLPDISYPILILGGEQGSGKSTIARIARRLTDPTTGDLLQPPECSRDLIAYARNNHVLAFDNLSKIDDDMADSLCRLSTGGELGGRALYSDHSLATFSARRPIAINGIPQLADRGDLNNRSFVLDLQPLSSRKTDEMLWREFDGIAGEVLGDLLDGVSATLRRPAHVDVVPDVRMSDFAVRLSAAEATLGWKPGEVVRAMKENQSTAVYTVIESDAVGVAIRDFVGEWLKQNPGKSFAWKGLTSELHTLLGNTKSDIERRSIAWPATPKAFGNRVARFMGPFREVGIDIRSNRTKRGCELSINNNNRAASTPRTPDAPETPQSRLNGAGGVRGVANSHLLHTGTDGAVDV